MNMNESMQQQHQAAATEEVVSPRYPPPPPPPPSQRRPRVREVSSRFMSPVISSSSSASSNSSSPLSKPHRSTSAQRPRQRHLDMEPLSCSDENRPVESVQIQSLENSPPLDSRCKASALPSTTHRKQRAVKLFKENGGGGRAEQHLQQTSKTYYGKIVSNAFPTPSRPDTPMITSSVDRERMMPSSSSRFRRSTNNSVTAAAKLLQSSGMSLPPAQSSAPQDLSSMTAGDSNHNPLVNCSTQSLPDFRSSMPEAEMLPTVSSRLLPEKNCTRGNVTAGGDSFKFSASPCSRSMNLPLSGSEHSLFHPTKGSDKQAYALSNSYTNSTKMGLCLPPVPPCSKLGTDARKGRKVSTHQEDVHTLRMLHNRYLQWRYANAKAEASIQARQRESERTLYSLMVKISELYDSVKCKRIKLGLLQRTKTLSTILENQIPYLEEWSAFEEDYLISLEEVIQALLNTSIQLPTVNVKADTSEMSKALNSAIKAMENILHNLQSFLPKAEDVECLISELARIIGGEKAFIEECGSLLSRTCTAQVEEFSLRGQIIQLHRFYHKDDQVKIE